MVIYCCSSQQTALSTPGASLSLSVDEERVPIMISTEEDTEQISGGTLLGSNPDNMMSSESTRYSQFPPCPPLFLYFFIFPTVHFFISPGLVWFGFIHLIGWRSVPELELHCRTHRAEVTIHQGGSLGSTHHVSSSVPSSEGLICRHRSLLKSQISIYFYVLSAALSFQSLSSTLTHHPNIYHFITNHQSPHVTFPRLTSFHPLSHPQLKAQSQSTL